MVNRVTDVVVGGHLRWMKGSGGRECFASGIVKIIKNTWYSGVDAVLAYCQLFCSAGMYERQQMGMPN